MSLIPRNGNQVFVCDGCSKVVDKEVPDGLNFSETPEFNKVKEHIKNELKWKITKDKRAEWVHFCPTCMGKRAEDILRALPDIGTKLTYTGGAEPTDSELIYIARAGENPIKALEDIRKARGFRHVHPQFSKTLVRDVPTPIILIKTGEHSYKYIRSSLADIGIKLPEPTIVKKPSAQTELKLDSVEPIATPIAEKSVEIKDVSQGAINIHRMAIELMHVKAGLDYPDAIRQVKAEL
jgi:hypothetical protein